MRGRFHWGEKADKGKTMWFVFAAIILVNAVADNKTFILEHRLSIGGMPFNVLDGLLVAGIVVSLLPQYRSPTDRVHRLLPWVLSLFAVALVGGSLAGMAHDLPLRWWLTPLRNMMAVPAMVWIGYRALNTPRSCTRTAYLFVLASLLSAVLVLVFVGDVTGSMAETSTGSFDELRSTSVGGDAGLVALGLILFCMIQRVRLMPTWLAVLVGGGCTAAIFLLPHRSGWIMAALTVAFGMFLLPKRNPRRKVAAGALGILLVAVSLVVAVQVVGLVSGRDFSGYVTKRLTSLLPGEQEGVQVKAWESRVPGAVRELELWSESPVFGQGIGYPYLDNLIHPELSYNHMPWVSVPAQTGLVGLLAYFLVIVPPIVIGWRMVREEVDRGSVLLGAAVAMASVSAVLVGFMSMNWNLQRPGMVIGAMCGAALRCRAMQLVSRREPLPYATEDLLPVEDFSAAPEPHAF